MAAVTAPRVGILARATARASRAGLGLQCKVSSWRAGDGAGMSALTQSLGGRTRPAWSSVWVRAKATSDSAPAERTTGKMTPERKEKQQIIELNPPRGTRDFPPEDLRLRQWLFGKFSEVHVPRAHAPCPTAPLHCCCFSRHALSAELKHAQSALRDAIFGRPRATCSSVLLRPELLTRSHRHWRLFHCARHAPDRAARCRRASCGQ